ncbi:unnamed protein product [Meloidogyne enterolobii]|uniref:Uncharacterized protein n=1 Tax=Meloidogyne enterolobii TaxID=390850 RepID=A0ACB0Z9Y3_MELEN
MDIRLKLAELQKSRKQRFPIDESSEFNQEQQQSEPYRYVRRGFGLVVNSSPGILSTSLAYFASTHVVITQIELQLGSEAFQRGVHVHEIQEVNENSYNFSGFLFCF